MSRLLAFVAGAVNCFKCGTPLAEAGTETGPPTAGGHGHVKAAGWYGVSSARIKASGRRVRFTSFRCPTCHRTRAVKAETE